MMSPAPMKPGFHGDPIKHPRQAKPAFGKVFPVEKRLTRQKARRRPVAVKLTKYELEKMFKRA